MVLASQTFDHLDMELWIVTYPVLRHTARVRVLVAFLQAALERKAALFAGESPRVSWNEGDKQGGIDSRNVTATPSGR